MGVLVDKNFKDLITNGISVSEPFVQSNLGPASIDLRLGNTRYKYNLESYVLGNPISEQEQISENFENFILEPNKTVFVALHEKITIPEDTMGLVIARSSLTRLGILIQSVYMNPGYNGILPLTITNASNFDIILEPGKRVAQLVLFSLNDKPEKLYHQMEDSKYFNESASSSKIFMDKEFQQEIDEIFKKSAPNIYNEIKKNQ